MTGFLCVVVGQLVILFFFFFQAEDGIRDLTVTGVQTCALPISHQPPHALRGTEGRRVQEYRRWGDVEHKQAEPPISSDSCDRPYERSYPLCGDLSLRPLSEYEWRRELEFH